MTSPPFDIIEHVIHVGIDGAWRESGALDWALEESALRHEPLRAVHVIDERQRRSSYWEPAVIDEAAVDLVEDVQAYLDENARSADHLMDLAVGRSAETLTRLAAGGDMLVVARRGAGVFDRLLIGSTAEAVAADATVPVVVVPDRWRVTDHGGPVVVGLDESGDEQAVMELAVSASVERQVTLRLVHGWELPGRHVWHAVDIARLVEDLEATVRRRLEASAQRWRGKYPDLVVEIDVWRGHPVECLVRAVEQYDAQLLVIGGRRRHLLGAKLLSSVARGVAQHAACPVAVVPVPVDNS